MLRFVASDFHRLCLPLVVSDDDNEIGADDDDDDDDEGRGGGEGEEDWVGVRGEDELEERGKERERGGIEGLVEEEEEEERGMEEEEEESLRRGEVEKRKRLGTISAMERPTIKGDNLQMAPPIRVVVPTCLIECLLRMILLCASRTAETQRDASLFVSKASLR